MCIYHSNFIEAVVALHKCVPSLPDYKNGFVEQFLCVEPKKDCWFGKCRHCDGISIKNLTDIVGNTSFDLDVSWPVWRKNVATKRIERQMEQGNLKTLLVHLAALSSQFLRHHFVKREQSDTFNKYDLQRASNSQIGHEGLLQIDFAENFVCESQDEVQSAHWNQRQLTLFTTALYYNGEIKSKVFVSDCLIHTKDTILPYLYKILSSMPVSLKTLKIWSDGPTSQFKNKFIAAAIGVLEEKFNIKIIWNFFATSHGKGCVDGIGATAKSVVRRHVKSRICIVNSASDFVNAFNRTASKISIEEVTEADFAEINSLLGSVELYANAKNVREITSAHQIRIINNNISTSETSKEGYNK